MARKKAEPTFERMSNAKALYLQQEMNKAANLAGAAWTRFYSGPGNAQVYLILPEAEAAHEHIRGYMGAWRSLGLVHETSLIPEYRLNVRAGEKLLKIGPVNLCSALVSVSFMGNWRAAILEKVGEILLKM